VLLSTLSNSSDIKQFNLSRLTQSVEFYDLNIVQFHINNGLRHEDQTLCQEEKLTLRSSNSTLDTIMPNRTKRRGGEDLVSKFVLYSMTYVLKSPGMMMLTLTICLKHLATIS
jgi:hypothetical protein